ncbi:MULTISPECIES: endonuclease/exonuclease/phosphatase family protein [Prauserella salsuginis group]|uniref:Endonuclease/exonuclease/phosphatase family protein n=1 Tax=Prauserella salsuginis TaxID=387889 RepID=A0ABW6FYI1_9PSEU|nr:MULTISPECIES: endonuclease/exonuclease/phosphatase family protein [Prauserella salsuginis group]
MTVHSRRATRVVSALSATAVAGSLALATPANAEPQSTPEATADSRIHDVQGTGRISPMDGETVTVPGVVTAKRQFGSARGFWVQDPQPDDDPRTSEALFVYNGDETPDVAVGDEVSVTGEVGEYRPQGQDSAYQSSTQLTGAEWTVASSGNELPEAARLTPDAVPETLAPEEGDLDELELRPDKYALDFWEAHEGERVSVADVPLVSRSTDYDELYVTTKPEQNRTPRGGVVYGGYDDGNTGRLKIESLIPFSERPFPTANVGDTLTGTTTGPLEYDQYGGYTMQATELGEVESGGIERETTREQRPSELSVATYNVENLSAVDEQAKFDDLAEGIVKHLRSPDVVTLEEIQDNNGADGNGDGVVAADETLDRFAEAIEAAGGPKYEYRQIDPQELTDGGQPGGNIRVGFLFDPDRVSFVDREGGDATTAVEVEQTRRGAAKLSVSPGRVDPQHEAWDDSRKPLAGEFTFRGRTVFVVANHFASKGGDEPTHGRHQPPTRSSEKQRHQQAEVVRGFVDELQQVQPNANVVVAGDLNDFQFSDTLGTLTEGGALTSLIDTLPAGEQYSYVYEGNSQVLDHILVSDSLRRVDYDVVRINAEFAEQASDHDPQIVRFRPSAGHFLDYWDWFWSRFGG